MLLVIDNVLPEAELHAVQNDVKSYATHPDLITYDNLHERKHALDTRHLTGSLKYNHTFLEQTALRYLSRPVGTKQISVDPSGRGSGLHWLPPQGFLGLHQDGNWHPDLALRRYANSVFYVEGDDESPFIIENIVIPFKPNRLVIFVTLDNPIHGIPTPVKVPRYTLASFFYSNDPEPLVKHKALFVGASEEFNKSRSTL